MATPTAFSYAQAAKGQAATTTATAVAQSTENSKDSVGSANGEQPTTEPNAVKSGSVEEENARNTSLKAQLAAKQDVVAVQPDTNVTNNTSAAGSVTDFRRDDEDATTESSARRSDKSVRSASASTRVTDDAEPKKGSRKPRKGKAGKESSEESKKDKVVEQEKEQPKVELKEAPLPTVNIWTQRKETQAAKTSVTLPAASRSDSTAATTDAWPNSQESKKKTKATEASEVINGTVNGVKPQRKAGDGDAAARRSGTRGSRMIERDSRATEAPPPVGDVSSWPTPETAVKETVKEEKRKPAERTERTETEAQDESGPKGRSKDKWERMEFVPSVQFSTPIPSVRGSRGGRGGARGGRDVSSRGGHGTAAAAAAGDKPAGAAAPAKTGGEARDRARDGNAPARTNSQPPAANKRASMDVSNAKEQRKSTVPASSERVKDSQSNATTEQTGPVRERGEGRSDRGRGGYRGRGGHPGNVPMHSQQPSYGANGATYGSQGHSRQYSSPPLHQGGSFPSYGGSQPRGGRGGRGQSNASGAFRGVGGSSNAGRMRQVQANMGQVPWEYTMPQPAGFALFDNARNLAIPQIEYYFSVENLLKDQFLRKHMDSQGFVKLDLVLAFPRIAQIGVDHNSIRNVLMECLNLDFVYGDDGADRLRSRHHWQKFVLPDMEQRFESARNAGPRSFVMRSFHSHPSYMNGGMVGDYSVYSPNGFPYAPENGYMPYPNEGAAGQLNGAINGTETQLSAHVPEFQPGTSSEQMAEVSVKSPTTSEPTKSQPLVNGSAEAQESAPLTNGNHSQATEALQS